MDTHPDYTDRHPSTQHFMREGMLVPNPNLPDDLRDISEAVWTTARALVDTLPDGPELSAGLRHLIEAKDCFVRAKLLG